THGCFWHHHHCYLFKVPATRTAFWLEKIGKNVERDERDIQRLSHTTMLQVDAPWSDGRAFFRTDMVNMDVGRFSTDADGKYDNN
ncbi:hypothetical protein MJI46_32550, partial [Salmonella enterica subsp. enterica serovar Cerro]|nr:hypothetical protein [Salmonella enterica subsp. enterica serovar Cerro]